MSLDFDLHALAAQRGGYDALRDLGAVWTGALRIGDVGGAFGGQPRLDELGPELRADGVGP